MSDADFRYRAFISYSHSDERWASWLHKALERYRVPRRLVGRSTPTGLVPARITPVFRDREELPSATDLSRVVNTALEQSAALIVICSPAAARSRWVNEEIRSFQRLGRRDKIFCLIVDGDPGALDALQCFPEALRRPLDAEQDADSASMEPIGADVRPGKDRRGAALLKIIAGLLGVGLDELVRRELQRRNRRLVALAAASVAGMALTSVLATFAVISRVEAERQRARAEVEAATAAQTSEFLVQLFEVVDPGEARGNSITAREILDRGVSRIDRGLADQPVVRANLLHTMGRVYTGLGLYESSTDLLQRAFALRDTLEQAPAAELVATANALGLALYLKGEYALAESAYRDALARARALYPDGHPLVTEAMAGVASLYWQNGDFAAAEAEYVAALAIDRKLHGDDHRDVARSLFGLSRALLDQNRFDESESALRESLAIRRRLLGEDHPLVAETLNELGTLLYFAGRSDAAEPIFREAVERYRRLLGNEHPELSSMLNNLGRVSLELGNVEEADAVLEEALAIDRKVKDAGHDDFVYTLNNLALARLGLGNVDAAGPLFEEARTIAEAHGHRMLGQVWANLADVYWRTGRVGLALQAVETARPLLAAAEPDEPWHLANLQSIEGAALAGQGRASDALPLVLESTKVIEERWGPDGLFTRLARDRAARVRAAASPLDAEPR
jgi:tetratricopeptide (TPR) repeat protein